MGAPGISPEQAKQLNEMGRLWREEADEVLAIPPEPQYLPTGPEGSPEFWDAYEQPVDSPDWWEVPEPAPPIEYESPELQPFVPIPEGTYRGDPNLISDDYEVINPFLLSKEPVYLPPADRPEPIFPTESMEADFPAEAPSWWGQKEIYPDPVLYDAPRQQYSFPELSYNAPVLGGQNQNVSLFGMGEGGQTSVSKPMALASALRAMRGQFE